MTTFLNGVLQAIRITFLVAIFIGTWIGALWLTADVFQWNPTMSGAIATAAALWNTCLWVSNTSGDDEDDDE